MSNLEQHLILHHLDDPLRVLYWTVDEAAVLIFSPFIGVMINQPLMGGAFSIFGTWLIIKLKKMLGGGTLKHALYWHFPHNRSRLGHTPPSCIREYIG